MEWLAQGDSPHTHYQRHCSLWVKYAGRRHGSIDFDIRLHHVQRDAAAEPGIEVENDQGVVSGAPAPPKALGQACFLSHSFPCRKLSSPWTGEQRGVLACTITILRTCGLRDPDAVSQPLFEITNAPL